MLLLYVNNQIDFRVLCQNDQKRASIFILAQQSSIASLGRLFKIILLLSFDMKIFREFQWKALFQDTEPIRFTQGRWIKGMNILNGFILWRGLKNPPNPPN